MGCSENTGPGAKRAACKLSPFMHCLVLCGSFFPRLFGPLCWSAPDTCHNCIAGCCEAHQICKKFNLHIDSLFSIDQCGYTHVNALVTSGNQLLSSNCGSYVHNKVTYIQQLMYSWHASRHLMSACHLGAGIVARLFRLAPVRDLFVCRYLH